MTVGYGHTQRGGVLIAILGFGAALDLTIAALIGRRDHTGLLVTLTTGVALLVALVLFSAMTVTVDAAGVTLIMLRGLLVRRFPHIEIAACRVVRNPWYAGLGIHAGPGYVVYNVSGRSAVELELSSGRRVRLGSDEPDALAAAIGADKLRR